MSSLSEAAIVVEQPYEVSAIERGQELHAQTGALLKKTCKWHAKRECVIAVSEAGAKSKVERSLTKELNDEQAEALIDRLEWRVDLAENFRG